MSDAYAPKPEHKFTFGLWTVGNPGRDPFGAPDPPVLARSSSSTCWPRSAPTASTSTTTTSSPSTPRPPSGPRSSRDFKKALADTGLKVPMATTNLFSDPSFKDGAFTSNDPRVRAYALQKTMRNIDLGVELGAKVYVFWGGREGSRDRRQPRAPLEALKWYREG